MKHLYAPWRGKYIIKKNKNITCVFCHQHNEADDAKNFIIKRLEHCAIMLNLFPYNPGHIMVIPYRHAAKLYRLSPAERAEMMEAANLCTKILTKELKATAFNVGVNLGGHAAGGSIPHHLHLHVLPRYPGDTSFLTTLAETKQIPLDLTTLYEKLHKAFAKAEALRSF